MAVRPIEEQDCEEDATEAECEHGARKAEMMRSPSLPSGAEVEEHEKTHLPFRSWCRDCVGGKGKQAEHRRLTQAEVGQELHMNFAFMGVEESEELIPFWWQKKGRRGCSCQRGCTQNLQQSLQRRERFASGNWVRAHCNDCKSDDELAMSALVTQIGKLRAANGGQRFSVEMSSAFSSASNVVERGVQTVQGKVRVLRRAAEEKWRVKLETAGAQHMAMVGGVRVRGEVGQDGKTLYELCKAPWLGFR